MFGLNILLDFHYLCDSLNKKNPKLNSGSIIVKLSLLSFYGKLMKIGHVAIDCTVSATILWTQMLACNSRTNSYVRVCAQPSFL